MEHHPTAMAMISSRAPDGSGTGAASLSAIAASCAAEVPENLADISENDENTLVVQSLRRTAASTEYSPRSTSADIAGRSKPPT